jgi:hypothetical protein
MPKRTVRDFSTLIPAEDRQADGFFEEQRREAHRPAAARLVSIPLSQVIPDRFQPRPILPLEIKESFFRGEIDCYQAARTWMEWAKSDAVLQAQVERLLNMGHTFEEHGQIKPATGAWTTLNGRPIFRLETGERRFWAAALNAVQHNLPQEPTLEVREIAEPKRERQIIENQHAEPPSAVGRAREVAALILSNLGIEPDASTSDEYAYFQQALQVERMPAGLWGRLEEIMGIQRPQMVRLLGILRLPVRLLTQADLYQVPERVLREILDLPENEWEPALKAAVRGGLTHEQVVEFVAGEVGAEVGKSSPPAGSEPTRLRQTVSQKAARRVKAFLKLAMRKTVRDNIGAVATELMGAMQDRQEALEAAELLEELAKHLRLRAERR